MQLRFLEYNFIFLVVVLVVTQVVVPTIRNLPLFSMFRSKKALEKQLEAARAKKAEADLQREIARTEREAYRITEDVYRICSGCGGKYVSSVLKTEKQCPDCGEPWSPYYNPTKENGQ